MEEEELVVVLRGAEEKVAVELVELALTLVAIPDPTVAERHLRHRQ